MTHFSPPNIAAVQGPRVVRGACPHDCPDTCAMLVTVQDGRATRVAGDPDHPFTQGFLCTKVNRYVERTYHRDRLLQPRGGLSQGGGVFERICWGEQFERSWPANYIAGPHGPCHSPLLERGTMAWSRVLVDRLVFPSSASSSTHDLLVAGRWMRGGRRHIGSGRRRDSESDLVLLWGTNTSHRTASVPVICASRHAGRVGIAIIRSVPEPRLSATSGFRFSRDRRRLALG